MPAARHPVCKGPDNPREPVWRYMDFTKYVSLLETSSLYFCRSDKLGDPFEGSTTKANHDRVLQLEKYIEEHSQKHGESTPRSLIQGLKDIAVFSREHMYINCWHLNDSESEAMWRLYAQTNEAVAIKSTYKRLYECLPSFAHLSQDSDRDENIWFGESIYVGKVNYIDYKTDFLDRANALYPYIHKRKSFAHEHEIRAIYEGLRFFPHLPDDEPRGLTFKHDVPNPVCGVYIPIDLMQLIEQVYVAPTAPKWFLQLVKDVTRQYGFDMPVQQSDLDADPVFSMV